MRKNVPFPRRPVAAVPRRRSDTRSGFLKRSHMPTDNSTLPPSKLDAEMWLLLSSSFVKSSVFCWLVQNPPDFFTAIKNVVYAQTKGSFITLSRRQFLRLVLSSQTSALKGCERGKRWERSSNRPRYTWPLGRVLPRASGTRKTQQPIRKEICVNKWWTKKWGQFGPTHTYLKHLKLEIPTSKQRTTVCQ